MLRRGEARRRWRTDPIAFAIQTEGVFCIFFCFLKNTSVAHPVPLAVAHLVVRHAYLNTIVAHLVVRHAYLDTTVVHHAVRHGYEIAVTEGLFRCNTNRRFPSS